MFVAKRSTHNPIFTPHKDHHWEGFALFNMCPVVHGKKIYGLFRAISVPDQLRTPSQMSIIGRSESKDGVHFENHAPFIEPTEEWDKFGCEDPRTTFFEGKFYTFYTALSKYPPDSGSIKVAVAVSKNLKKVDEKHLVTTFNAKAMTLFPGRVNGKVTVIFSAHTDSPPAKIVIAQADKIEELWDPAFWENWQRNIDDFVIDSRRTPYDHVEVGAPPIKTKYGWLLVYSHIQNYFGAPNGGERIFGIEALLLDTKDPREIVGRTGGPMLVPVEPYELSGFVPNIVFPSGALLSKDKLTVYYGAADTTVCSFQVNINDLIGTMHPDTKDRFRFKRFAKNPIILPRGNGFESKATLNPAAIMVGGKTHILYRAMSEDNTSTFGHAVLRNHTEVETRTEMPVYVPREDFESKKVEGGNSGCEDPRLTKIGKNIFLCYTAYDGVDPPRVAVSYISEKDFLKGNWNWSKPYLVTPPGVDDKDTCIFPGKFPLGYMVFHRIGNEICGDYVKNLDFKNEKIEKCIRVMGPRTNSWDSWKIGIAAPPIKTRYGWLLLYHGVSKSHSTYRVGALLLDLKDPTIVISRSTDPIFEPEEKYEKEGIVNNVVFPCGMVKVGKLLYIYYGGGDKVVGGATMEIDIIVKALLRGK